MSKDWVAESIEKCEIFDDNSIFKFFIIEGDQFIHLVNTIYPTATAEPILFDFDANEILDGLDFDFEDFIRNMKD